MANLPKLEWNVDPVFFQIPRPVVLVVAALIAGYAIVQEIRKKSANPLWTLLVFGGLTALAWKFTQASLGYAYFLGLIAAFVAEGVRRKATDNYVTAALFASLGFLAWRFLPENLDLRYYSLLFVGVFLGGYSFLKWQIVRGGGPAEDAGDFIVYGVLGVLVGARLGHVIFYDFKKALDDPTWIVQIWTGGLASHGAVIGLIFAMWLFTKRRGIPFLEGADRFAFSAALGATLVRIGNLMNSEIVGRRVPGDAWGLAFPRFDHNEKPAPFRYPTQFGEIFLGLLVLLALFLVDKKLGKEKRPRGALIATFFVVYFVGRFIVEFWKEFEPPLKAGEAYPSSLTTGQLLSLPGIALGIFGLYWALKNRIPVGWPNRLVENAEERQLPRPKRKAKRRDDDDERNDDDDDDDERKPDKAAAKPAAAPRAEDDERDEDDDEAPREDESGRESDEDEEKRADEGGDDDDDESDDDENDDDDELDAQQAPSAKHDPDIDDEFDEKGALKRRRGPSEG